MPVLERHIDQISEQLIEYLRGELSDCTINYSTPLTPLPGANEAHIYQFRVECSHQGLSRPSVLRLYPSNYGKRRVELESSIQNILADAGYLVPRVYLKCTDKSVLGGTFFIMEYLPGEPMVSAPVETIPALLGATHAALHQIDLSSFDVASEFSKNEYKIEGRLRGLQRYADKQPWLRDCVEWLMDECPAQPARLAICHGDFHPRNILIQDGRVTAVLDWPGFTIGDPAMDVAFTTVILNVAIEHIFPDIVTADISQKYLEAYCAQRPLDLANFEYYKVLRSVTALVDGAEGQELWRLPPVLRHLVEYIYSVTGVEVRPPHREP